MKRIVVALGFFVVIAVALATHALALGRGTRFAPGFSRQTLARLAYGASTKNVQAALGNPLTIRRYSTRNVWVYCLVEPSPIVTGRGLITERSELSIEGCPTIAFDDELHIAEVSGIEEGLSAKLVGQDQRAALDLLGEPPVRRRGGTYVVWYYSQPVRPECTFESATVTFDPRGRLVDKRLERVSD